MDSYVKQRLEDSVCGFCHRDENGEVLHEQFTNDELGVAFSLDFGDGGVNLLIHYEDNVAVHRTKGKYCTRCGRLLVDKFISIEEQKKEQAECRYCHTDGDGEYEDYENGGYEQEYVYDEDTDFGIGLDFVSNALYYWVYDGMGQRPDCIKSKIGNYCMYCGRKLKKA